MIVGLGIDVIEVKRVGDAIDRHKERFTRRIFTQREIDYCSTKKSAMLHYAGRFASKEAAFKAMGTGWSGSIAWADVEVTNLPSGAPEIHFYGKALERIEAMKAVRAFVSISHIEGLAAAVVVLEAD